MPRNIELKARLHDLDRARRIAGEIGQRQETQAQRDTYFHCSRGRLKLREINGDRAELIWYARPDQPDAKASDYRIVPTSEPARLCEALSAAYGVWQVVEKRREIFLVQNVRIHLDEVAMLGAFLEFEAVLTADQGDAQGHAQLARLSEQFSIDPSDLLQGSYSDLL